MLDRSTLGSHPYPSGGSLSRPGRGLRTQVVLALLTSIIALEACSSDAMGTDDQDFDPDADTFPYPVGKVFFSHPPVGLEDVFFFESMGALYTPFQEDHGGFFHTGLFGDQGTTIPVIAPAAGQVIVLRTHEGHVANEYAVRLKVSTTIELLWGHVGTLSPKLASEASPLGTSINVRIPVEAGEVIGYAANTALDLAVNDLEIRTAILHPEFYSSNPYAAPLEDYFQEPLKSQIIALTLREAEPRTGKMGHDVAGTLSGLWFREGSDPTVFSEENAFQFGYHHLVAGRATVFDGLAYSQQNSGEGGISLWTFWIKGNPRMESITPNSGLVKWEMYPSTSGLAGSFPNWTLQDTSGLDDTTQTESILLVEMLNEDTVQLERIDAVGTGGISSDDVTGFTSNARTYHRDPLS